MTRKEKLRESMTTMPSLEHLTTRIQAGWKLVAIEWERERATAAADPLPSEPLEEDIPYGLRVSDDCSGLVESPSERQVVITALDMIVDDQPLSRVADELNRRGHTTREGQPWTPTVLFTLLPRMIEIGPRIFTSTDWSTRKQRLPRVV
jgi:hypothetical protein